MKNRQFLGLIVIAFFLFISLGQRVASAAPARLPDFLTEPGERTGRRTALFLMAHYDDDSTIAGTLSLFIREGWDVHLAWVTSAGMDGGIWGTPESRLAEAKVAVQVYGLDENHWHLIGFPDRGTIEDLPGVCDRVTELIRQLKPSVVVTTAYEGGNWDHDAAGLAADVASLRLDFEFERFEAPTYNKSGPKIMPYRVNNFVPANQPTQWVQLDREAYRIRKAVRKSYRSQWFLMQPFGILGAMRHLAGKGEPIRKTPDFDFLEPPHPGPLLYNQRWTGLDPGGSFERWQRSAEKIPELSHPASSAPPGK